MLNIESIKKDFPILSKKIHGNKDLIYFDNAASSQKPNCVIEAISDYYKNSHANIHRAFHYLGDHATELFEQSRETVAKYINANKNQEVIFTKGTTEGINLVATSLERSNIFEDGDEIILSVAEHHSNIVPWQILVDNLKTHNINIYIKIVGLLDNGDLNLVELYSLINSNTKLIALNHVSNGMGIINNIFDIIKQIKAINNNILTLIDGAQAVPNFKIDVQKLDCDFYVFSGHKVYGPTGIGVLYGKYDILDNLAPYQGGGEMIDHVFLPTGTTYAQVPQKFEAGTQNIAGAIGLAAALQYLQNLDLNKLINHKIELTRYCTTELVNKIRNIKIYGNFNKDYSNKISVIAFTVNNINAQDIGLMLDQYGIAVRTGHHCNMPLMDYLGIAGTVRASFGIYNTKDEIDIFITSLQKVIDILS